MKKITLLLFLFFSCEIFAQNKILSTNECVFAYQQGLYPQRLTQLGWLKDLDQYYYVDNVNGIETLLSSNASGKGQIKKITDLTALNDMIKKLNVNADPLTTFPVITWTSNASFLFEDGNLKFSYFSSENPTLTNLKEEALPEKAANQDESSLGNIAYTIGNNLFVRANVGVNGSAMHNGEMLTATLQVTNDADTNIVNGKSVHREEFGISKGTFWSPSGNLLAFYRMDQTMVTDYPIMDLKKQPAQAHMIKYPMAGATSHQVTVGVYNVVANKTVFLKTGEPKDQYLTNIAWSPDNKFVYISVLNRDQNHLWLNRYNAETGDLDKTLFEETDPKYVHPMHPLMFVPQHNDEFIWQSERFTSTNVAGANTLYLYSTDGKLIEEVAPFHNSTGDSNISGQVVTAIYGFDPNGNTIYFQGAPLNSCDKEIYSFDLNAKNAVLKKLTSNSGTHSAQFSWDRKFFIDTYSSVANPGIQSIIDANGKQIKTLLTAKNPLADYKYCRVKLSNIIAADNSTILWCRTIFPADFDSTKKYKSLTYVYNGPNVQLVTNSWLGGADLFLYYMAQQGFVVFTVDGRGSDNRGMKFEQATFQHLGTQEIADQEKGNQYLRSQKYIDANRMAVYGWSFGGFMTTSLMTRKPDLYKCGVAGGPVIDWSYYEVMYTERYMDTPQSNPEGYKEACLVNYAGNLKGKLMQIHGTSDDVVVWQHSLLFQKACVDKNVQCDYYVYPGHLHNVRGKDRVNLLTKISEYVIANT